MRDVRRCIVEGDELLLDCVQASVVVRPTPGMDEAFEAKLATTQRRVSRLRSATHSTSPAKNGEYPIATVVPSATPASARAA